VKALIGGINFCSMTNYDTITLTVDLANVVEYLKNINANVHTFYRVKGSSKYEGKFFEGVYLGMQKDHTKEKFISEIHETQRI
jgi:hypothetical protein